MKRHLPAIVLAVLVVVMGSTVVLHALFSRRSAPVEPGPAPVTPTSAPLAGLSGRDPFGQHLFPPELILRFQTEIGLSDEQRAAITAAVTQAQPQLERGRQQIQRETAALSPLLAMERVDTAAVLAQTDKIQDLERDLKRTHLALLITLKNHLTAAQQSQLQGIKQQTAFGLPAPNPPQAILEKMQQLQAGVQRCQREGRDSAAIEKLMGTFEPLLRANRFNEAEGVLDRALELLQEGKPR